MGKLLDSLGSERPKVVRSFTRVLLANQRLFLRREGVYVAIKIGVADEEHKRELQASRELSSHNARLKYTVHLLDSFDLRGPNGSHKCLVQELLGPNIPDAIDAYFPSRRLPGKLAKVIAKQALIGLDSLHQRGVGHGGKPHLKYFEKSSSKTDIHTRNLAFTLPCVDDLTEEEFIKLLGKPELGYIRKTDESGLQLEPGIPKYLVRPTSYQARSWTSTQPAKIIDFGESFLRTAVPHTLHTPLPVRAPEIIFQDSIDYHVDLWSMGCMVSGIIEGLILVYYGELTRI